MPTCSVCSHVYETGTTCPRCGAPAPDAPASAPAFGAFDFGSPAQPTPAPGLADDLTVLRPVTPPIATIPAPEPDLPNMPARAYYPNEPAGLAACPSCGAANTPGATYCVQCGSPLSATAPAMPGAAFGAPAAKTADGSTTTWIVLASVTAVVICAYDIFIAPRLGDAFSSVDISYKLGMIVYWLIFFVIEGAIFAATIAMAPAERRQKSRAFACLGGALALGLLGYIFLWVASLPTFTEIVFALSNTAPAATWLILRNRKGLSYLMLIVPLATNLISYFAPVGGSLPSWVWVVIWMLSIVAACWLAAIPGFGAPTTTSQYGSVAPASGTPAAYNSQQAAYGAQPGYPLPASAQTNGFAIAALILGLLGGSILAVIFGHVARGQIRRTGEQGSGLALAGLILGYIGLAAVLVMLIALFALGVWASQYSG